ncbi:hypothetical protein BD560DRAFT_427159 [Blakeslea trispora]|nr:hypothetical protein BD560DRAFT_427159 [Blakeslea trispora]
MKFSSALISATLLATAVFAAPEPQAPASASASEMSVASEFSAASMSAASEFASASASAMYDVNASMDIANLLKEGGVKKYDDDDYHHGDYHDYDDHHDHDDYYGHGDKKDDGMIYVVGSEHKHDFCNYLTQTFITSLFDKNGISSTTFQPAGITVNDQSGRVETLNALNILFNHFSELFAVNIQSNPEVMLFPVPEKRTVTWGLLFDLSTLCHTSYFVKKQMSK